MEPAAREGTTPPGVLPVGAGVGPGGGGQGRAAAERTLDRRGTGRKLCRWGRRRTSHGDGVRAPVTSGTGVAASQTCCGCQDASQKTTCR